MLSVVSVQVLVVPSGRYKVQLWVWKLVHGRDVVLGWMLDTLSAWVLEIVLGRGLVSLCIHNNTLALLRIRDKGFFHLYFVSNTNPQHKYNNNDRSHPNKLNQGRCRNRFYTLGRYTTWLGAVSVGK
jgi:hypothetical protein